MYKEHTRTISLKKREVDLSNHETIILPWYNGHGLVGQPFHSACFKDLGQRLSWGFLPHVYRQQTIVPLCCPPFQHPPHCTHSMGGCCVFAAQYFLVWNVNC